MHVCIYIYANIDIYMYTYLCFIKVRNTFSKYIKMIIEIIFEVYVFIANKYNYMRNNYIPSISVFYFFNKLLCLVLLVTLEQLSMH